MFGEIRWEVLLEPILCSAYKAFFFDLAVNYLCQPLEEPLPSSKHFLPTVLNEGNECIALGLLLLYRKFMVGSFRVYL